MAGAYKDQQIRFEYLFRLTCHYFLHSGVRSLDRYLCYTTDLLTPMEMYTSVRGTTWTSSHIRADEGLLTGHALNKILKDVINRYKLLRGYRIQ